MIASTQKTEGMPAWHAYVVDVPQKRLLPNPPTHDFVIERGLRIPMRDGVVLSATLWRPKSDGAFPVLVERGPHRLEERTGPPGEYYAERGYAVLGVGLRGCSGSGGEFAGPIPGAPSDDGYDTVEWVATQPWCNGRVGMICGSISGLTQYQTAVEAPPHLSPLLVREGPTRLQIARNASPGLLMLQSVAVSWTENQLEHFPPELQKKAQELVNLWQNGWHDAQEAAESGSPFLSVPEMLRQLPLHPNPNFSDVADYYNEWIVPLDTDLWREQADLLVDADRVQVPICHLGGWFDSIVTHTISAYVAMANLAATEIARNGQRLVIGPWVHGPMATNGEPVGQLEFGPNAALDFFAFRQRWYDAHLNGQGDLSEDPSVWLYLIGPDEWLGFDSWPPPIDATCWYLDEEALLEATPADLQPPDSYRYDPDDPVPTLDGGGAMGIGLDQGPIEDRLLSYTSSPLSEPLALVGPLRCVLHASSSAVDTDWIVRLTMVRPDGASIILSGGAQHARFRHGSHQPALLTADQPERFQIEMLPLSIVIPEGHRLRLTVTSSDFPAFARNLNTDDPVGLGHKMDIAINRIFHDRAHLSYVELPILT